MIAAATVGLGTRPPLTANRAPFTPAVTPATVATHSSGTPRRNGDPDQRLPNTLSVSFDHVQADELLRRIADRVAASAGSACHAQDVKLSRITRFDPPQEPRYFVHWSAGMPRGREGRSPLPTLWLQSRLPEHQPGLAWSSRLQRRFTLGFENLRAVPETLRFVSESVISCRKPVLCRKRGIFVTR
jgi:hypothetical protein